MTKSCDHCRCKNTCKCIREINACQINACDASIKKVNSMKMKVSSKLSLPYIADENTRIISVPSKCYPTIQSAIDSLAGLNTGNVTIKVAPGTYRETLQINKVSSSVSRGFTVQPYPSFSIVGDSRQFGALCYLQNGNIPRASDPNFGNPASTVSLVNGPNTIQVTTPGVNFTAIGLVNGDKIKIRDNNGVWNVRNVTAFTTDTITYDGSALTVGGLGSAFVFLPNVELLGVTPSQPALYVSGASVNIEGFWLNTDVSRGAAVGMPTNMSVVGSGTNVNSLNCVFDDSTYNLTDANVTILQQASLTAVRYTSDNNSVTNISPITVIGIKSSNTNALVNIYNLSNINFGNWSLFDSAGVGFGCAVNTGVDILSGSFQAVACVNAVLVEYNSHFDCSGRSYFAQCSVSSVQCVQNSTALLGPTLIDGGGLARFGLLVNNGAFLQFRSSTTIQNCQVGVLVASTGTTNINARTILLTIQNVLIDVATGDNQSFFDASANKNGTVSYPATPANVYTYTATSPVPTAFTGSIAGTSLTVTAVASGELRVGQLITGPGIAADTFVLNQVLPLTAGEAIGGVGRYTLNVASAVGPIAITGALVLANEFVTQLIDSASPVSLSMDPGQLVVNDTRWQTYLGKVFTVSSLTAAAHTLSLPGAFFVQFGQPNATVATFNGVNSSMTFVAETATRVRVLEASGMLFA